MTQKLFTACVKYPIGYGSYFNMIFILQSIWLNFMTEHGIFMLICGFYHIALEKRMEHVQIVFLW